MVAMGPGLKGLLSEIQPTKSRRNRRGSVTKLSLWGTICLVCVFCAVQVIASPNVPSRVLRVSRGATVKPPMRLFRASMGTSTGQPRTAESTSNGVVFKVTPAGKVTTLSSFSFGDCAYPEGSLVLSTNGSFYGITYRGGVNRWRRPL